ncbi:hypothetical protein, partial [Baaleninema sp.]|uniref:hypothetical protein n=1 Tax=Baaleninema sp. TaxID=3101197 RepID=UPI003CFE485F
ETEEVETEEVETEEVETEEVETEEVETEEVETEEVETEEVETEEVETEAELEESGEEERLDREFAVFESLLGEEETEYEEHIEQEILEEVVKAEAEPSEAEILAAFETEVEEIEVEEIEVEEEFEEDAAANELTAVESESLSEPIAEAVEDAEADADAEIAEAAIAPFLWSDEDDSEDEESSESPGVVTASDTISTLNELRGESLAAADDRLDDEDDENPQLLSPDEDVLLPEDRETESGSHRNGRDFDLDETTRNQLEADLQDLERPETALDWALDSPTESQPPSQRTSDKVVEELEQAFEELAEAFFDGDEEEFVNPFVFREESLEDAAVSPPRPPLPPPPRRVSVPPPIWLENDHHRSWYLGLDWTDAGLSAVLFDRETNSLYPLGWERESHSSPVFQLPSVAVRSEEGWTVGFDAMSETGEENELRINPFQPGLEVGVPWTDETGRDRPVVQWTETIELPLSEVCDALRSLLEQVKTARPYEGSPPVPAKVPDIASLFSKLGGVVVGETANSEEAYRFNLREAILKAGLTPRPDRVFFLDRAIATLFFELHHSEDSQESPPSPSSPRGSLLVMVAGLDGLSVTLANLVEGKERLVPQPFVSRCFPYGKRAVEEDIVVKGILENDPELSQQFGLSQSDRVPETGRPDLETRIAFRQRLNSSPSWPHLQELIADIDTALAEIHYIEFELNGRRHRLDRQTLDRQILRPWLEWLNREFNQLLSVTGISVEGIDRVLCLGDSLLRSSLVGWLRYKLPNAVRLETPTLPLGVSETAMGLALLPHFQETFDVTETSGDFLERHQYSDWFLFRELLETCPDGSFSVPDIFERLEQRGIPTRRTGDRIARFLDGELPSGLVPTPPNEAWLTAESRELPRYARLRETPTFVRDDDRTYRSNPEQRNRWRQYFQFLTRHSRQTLRDPLSAKLANSKP